MYSGLNFTFLNDNMCLSLLFFGLRPFFVGPILTGYLLEREEIRLKIILVETSEIGFED